MRKWFSFFTPVELVIFGTCGLFKWIHGLLNYKMYYLPLKKEIVEFYNRGYLVKREGHLVKLNNAKFSDQFEFHIRLLSSDKHVFYQVLVENEYMPLVDLISKYNAGNSIKTIVDAGSNIGLSALFFNRYFPNAKIIALEPEISNFNLMRRNVETNSLKFQIFPLRKALWINSVDQLMIASDFRDGKDWSKSVRESNTSEGSVQAISLSDLMKEYEVNTIDILKLDVEGTENVLFNDVSFNALLKWVKFIALEIHDEVADRSSIEKQLIDKGFVLNRKNETVFGCNLKLIDR